MSEKEEIQILMAAIQLKVLTYDNGLAIPTEISIWTDEELSVLKNGLFNLLAHISEVKAMREKIK